MLKRLLTLFVAFVAMISFSSCNDSKTISRVYYNSLSFNYSSSSLSSLTSSETLKTYLSGQGMEIGKFTLEGDESSLDAEAISTFNSITSAITDEIIDGLFPSTKVTFTITLMVYDTEEVLATYSY